MTGGAFDLGSIVGHLVLDRKEWTQAVTAVRTDLAELKKSVKLKSDEIQAAGRVLAGFGASITATFGILLKSSADAGDQIHDLAERTGIATELLSGYKLAADKSGTSIDGFAVGVKILANNLQAANAKGGAQRDLFESLGIKYKDAAGNALPLDRVLLSIADKLSTMPGGWEKSAVAVDLFGKSGAELIPLMNLGAQGLEAEYREAKRLGMVFSQEAADAADEFNDSLTELKGAVQGVGNELAKSLLPALQPMIDRTKESVRWVRDFVATYPALSASIAELGIGLGVVAGVLGTICMLLPTFVKGWAVVYPFLVKMAPAILEIGAAWAGWEFGKWYGEVTGLNQAVQDQVSSGKGLVAQLLMLTKIMPDVNEEIDKGTGHWAANKIQVDAIAAAEKLAGREVKDFVEAKRLLRYEFQEAGTVGNAALDGWLARFPRLAPAVDGVGTSIKAILAEFNQLTKSELEAEFKKTTQALEALRASTEKTPGALQALQKKWSELWGQLYGAPPTIDAVTSSLDRLAKRFSDVQDGFGLSLDTVGAIEIPIELDVEGLNTQVEVGSEILKGFVEQGVEASAAATERAKATASEQQALYTQVFADIINGFTSIMDGSKTMGEAFRGIVTGMIADLGKLVIAEIMAAKKGILASQMAAVAHAIAGIFKSIPWFVAIPIAAGAFAVVSKLFSKLLSFDRGAVFEEKTLLPAHTVAENETEYYLPEKKLLAVFRESLAGMSYGPGPALAGAGAGAGGYSPVIHVTQNVTFQSLDRRSVAEARDMIFDAVDSKVVEFGRRSLRHG